VQVVFKFGSINCRVWHIMVPGVFEDWDTGSIIQGRLQQWCERKYNLYVFYNGFLL